MKKPLNICKQYGLDIEGFKVPYFGIYGFDKKSKFVCIHYPSPNYEGNAIYLFRWLQTKDGFQWVYRKEENATTRNILQLVRDNELQIGTYRQPNSKTLQKKIDHQKMIKETKNIYYSAPQPKRPQTDFDGRKLKSQAQIDSNIRIIKTCGYSRVTIEDIGLNNE